MNLKRLKNNDIEGWKFQPVLRVISTKALQNWKIFIKAYQNGYGSFDDSYKTINRDYNC